MSREPDPDQAALRESHAKLKRKPPHGNHELSPDLFGSWSGDRARRVEEYGKWRKKQSREQVWATWLKFMSERKLQEYENQFLLSEIHTPIKNEERRESP